MSIDRRSVLKGMAACGLSGPLLAGPLPVLAALAQGPGVASRPPSRLLVAQSVAGAVFVQGARAGQAVALAVEAASLDLAFLLGFERQLRSDRGVRWIGLLDDAVAAPLLELARGAGARLPWLGQHAAYGRSSRHRLLTTEATAGCASWLAAHLAACGAGFEIVLEQQAAGLVPEQLAGRADGSDHADEWAAAIGHVLASEGAPDMAMQPLLQAGAAPLSGSFVSFLIET